MITSSNDLKFILLCPIAHTSSISSLHVIEYAARCLKSPTSPLELGLAPTSSCANNGKFNVLTLNFLLFHVVDRLFLNLRGDLDLLIFPRGRQKGSFLLYFMLFLPNVMTFFPKNKCRDHPN